LGRCGCAQRKSAKLQQGKGSELANWNRKKLALSQIRAVGAKFNYGHVYFQKLSGNDAGVGNKQGSRLAPLKPSSDPTRRNLHLLAPSMKFAAV
jgi:hypothetical protein